MIPQIKTAITEMKLRDKLMKEKILDEKTIALIKGHYYEKKRGNSGTLPTTNKNSKGGP